jgi:hypothetical protein
MKKAIDFETMKKRDLLCKGRCATSDKIPVTRQLSDHQQVAEAICVAALPGVSSIPTKI